MKKKSKNIVDSKLFIITALTIGGALEWYEIGLFISWPLFIQQESAGFDVSIAESINAGTILLLVALAFANGGTRAIGAWFFGKIGDQKGRTTALPLTLLMATIPSWSIAILSFFLPFRFWITYSTVIFAIMKFFQGMPAGGEIPGAICYLAETADSHKHNTPSTSRRFICSFALIGPVLGTILSTALCLILSKCFSYEILMNYVWRYVFIISGIIGLIGFFMRRKLHETAAYLELKTHHKIAHKPIKTLFSKYSSNLILAFSLSIFEIIIFVIVYFLPFYYAKPPFNFSSVTVYSMVLIYSIIYTLLIPLFGIITSKYKSIGWLNLTVWGTIIISPLLYMSLVNGSFNQSIPLSFILMMFSAIQTAILPSMLAEIFPINIRYSGIAFSYNICDGLFWTTFIGICFLFLRNNSPAFILILPIAAMILPLTKQIARHVNIKIYKIIN